MASLGSDYNRDIYPRCLQNRTLQNFAFRTIIETLQLAVILSNNTGASELLSALVEYYAVTDLDEIISRVVQTRTLI